MSVKNSDGSLLSGVTAISVGDHTCALISTGKVKCWGNNNVGQLGNGTTTNSSKAVDVKNSDGSLLSGVKSITVNSQSCALLNSGEVKCWGNNTFGQVGDGTKINRLTPVTVNNLSGVTAIAAGDPTCAITDNGSKVKCWGINNVGDLGDGTTTDRSYPGYVIFAPDVTFTDKSITISNNEYKMVITPNFDPL